MFFKQGMAVLKTLISTVLKNMLYKHKQKRVREDSALNVDYSCRSAILFLDCYLSTTNLCQNYADRNQCRRELNVGT